ncbi:MAG: AAA family ATPase, partial [Halothiobacillaceae bacterium]
LMYILDGEGRFLSHPEPSYFGEMAREDLQARAAALMDTIAGIDRDAARANLAFMARTWQADGVAFPDLNERDGIGGKPSGQDVLFQAAREHGADIVFLDNFSTLADVADENDAAAMGPTLGFLMRLKAARIACVMVHHSGKTGDTYRGSSRLATTFEVIIGLKRLNDNVGQDGAAFSMEWTKYRGEPHPEVRRRDMRLTLGGEGSAWVVEAAASDKGREVVAAIQSCLYSSQDAVAAALRISKSEVSKRKRDAVRDGLITDREVAACFAEALGNASGGVAF